MRIHFQKLIHLPVVTESKVKLGQVQDLEIDIDSHGIIAYLVGGKFFSKDWYRIVPVQIKKISEKEIIVEDAVIKSGEEKIISANQQSYQTIPERKFTE